MARSLLIIDPMKTGLLAKGALVALAMAGATAVVASQASAPPTTASPEASQPSSGHEPGARDTAYSLTPQNRTLRAPEKIFESAYGSRANELGGDVPPEGLPECPGAVSVAPDGAIYVLDQINERIVKVRTGMENELIDIPGRTFWDMSLASDGSIVLLDRTIGESVAVVDPTRQRPTRELSIRNKFLDHTGEVSGVYARSDGIWIENDNQMLIRIADPEGNAVLQQVNGRFSSDGSRLLRAGIVSDRTVAVWQQPLAGGAAIESEVHFDTDIGYITHHAADADGRLWLTVALADEVAPGDSRNAHTEVVVLDRAGREISRATLPTRDRTWLQGRAYEVAADGSLYHLSCGQHSATLWKVSL